MMVRRLLPGCLTATADAADALAVAICHAHHARDRASAGSRRRCLHDRQAHRPRRFRVGATAAVIDVNGVGYLVFCSARTLARLPAKGAPASLLIETHVREDHIHLYGFVDAGRARLVPPADDGAGRRRQARAGDPRRAGARRSRPRHRGAGQGQPVARRPASGRSSRGASPPSSRTRSAASALGPGAAPPAAPSAAAPAAPMRSRRWSISAIAAPRPSARWRTATRRLGDEAPARRADPRRACRSSAQ